MINRRVLLSSLALLPTLWPGLAAAQQAKRVGSRAFSFAVYGDSRSMMYLPYKSDQREEAIKLMVDTLIGQASSLRLLAGVHP
jgi:hypothetical protein